MSYAIASGHDNEGGLATLTIQPSMVGFRAGRRRIAGTGLVVEDGLKSCTLVYGVLREDELDTVFTECQIDSVTSAEITISLPNENREFTNYNATIVRPDMNVDAQHNLGRFVNINIEVLFLEEL